MNDTSAWQQGRGRPGWSAAAQPEEVVPASNRLAWLLLLAPVLGVTLLSKFSFPPFNTRGIGVSLMLVILPPWLGLVTGRMVLDAKRLVVYLLMVSLLGAMQVFQPQGFSLGSLLLLFALHLPYVLRIDALEDGGRRALSFFVDLATFLAVCGIVQFFLQFVLGARLVFPIENFLPSSFLMTGYNMQAPLSYGVNVFRSNGLFMLEPSVFSQVLAIALVAELCTRNRLLRLALLGFAIVVSYSGTGMAVLAVCLPFIVVLKRRWDLLMLGLVAILTLLAFGDALRLDFLLGRVGEFGSSGSSGFQRFVGGFYLFDQFLWDNPLRTLFGYGAGNFREYASRSAYPVAEMALFKLVFEFGVLGALAYLGALIYFLFSADGVPWMVRFAVAITFVLGGVYVPFSHGLALSLLTWTGRRPGSPDPLGPAPQPGRAPPSMRPAAAR